MSRTIGRTEEQERARYNWITTGAAAERIGGEDEPVSTSHVLALIEAGEIRARHVGLASSKRKDWRVDPASIDEFLNKRTNVAA
jgi:hypothetical protein